MSLQISQGCQHRRGGELLRLLLPMLALNNFHLVHGRASTSLKHLCIMLVVVLVLLTTAEDARGIVPEHTVTVGRLVMSTRTHVTTTVL